jgi:hypothetical protein
MELSASNNTVDISLHIRLPRTRPRGSIADRPWLHLQILIYEFAGVLRIGFGKYSPFLPGQLNMLTAYLDKRRIGLRITN